jgi:hypothetical protein
MRPDPVPLPGLVVVAAHRLARVAQIGVACRNEN